MRQSLNKGVFSTLTLVAAVKGGGVLVHIRTATEPLWENQNKVLGLRAKRDFRVEPCNPTKFTICRCIITGKTPPRWSRDRSKP